MVALFGDKGIGENLRRIFFTLTNGDELLCVKE
jgi:hypothetical protein